MGKAKKISNALLIIMVVSALVVTVFVVTALIAPRYRKNGDTAANFFVALFKDPPDTTKEGQAVAVQSDTTGAITLALGLDASYKTLKIKVRLIDANAYDSDGVIKVLTFTDASGNEVEEEHIFTFENVGPGEVISEDHFKPSSKTLELKKYYIIKDVVYYE